MKCARQSSVSLDSSRENTRCDFHWCGLHKSQICGCFDGKFVFADPYAPERKITGETAKNIWSIWYVNILHEERFSTLISPYYRFRYAAKNGKEDRIRVLLKRDKSDVNKKDEVIIFLFLLQNLFLLLLLLLLPKVVPSVQNI